MSFQFKKYCNLVYGVQNQTKEFVKQNNAYDIQYPCGHHKKKLKNPQNRQKKSFDTTDGNFSIEQKQIKLFQ